MNICAKSIPVNNCIIEPIEGHLESQEVKTCRRSAKYTHLIRLLLQLVIFGKKAPG